MRVAPQVCYNDTETGKQQHFSISLASLPSTRTTDQGGYKLSNKPQRLILGDRPVTVWFHAGNVYALDANCYHACGPLEKGSHDIEDIGGQPCIRCPLHSYIISLSTGECFYKPVTFDKSPDGKLIAIPGEYISKGKKQRSHSATISGDNLLISLNVEPDGTFASDQFASAKIKPPTS
eukprot:GHVS01078214.1.p1 GENE.GHVS01078214.1~~GHVS01078214.1.p1  ORF type:complete len:178 (+),score=4.10 GHVS01078214.1:254-787(+)